MSYCIKAFIGIGFFLISINAFSFTPNNNKAINLQAENILFSSLGKKPFTNHKSLTLNALLSAAIYFNTVQFIDVFRNRNVYYFNLSNYQALANIFEVSAVISSKNNNIKETKSWLVQAFKMHQNLNNVKEMIALSQKISLLYYNDNQLEASLQFNKMAISLMESLNNQDAFFDLLVWRNNILLAQGKAYQVENVILTQMLLMATKSGEKQQEWQCFYQLGKSYLVQNKLVQAKWFFVQALTLSETFKDKTPKIKSLLMLARSKARTKDFSLAIQNLRLAESLAKRFNNNFERDVSHQMATIYSQL